MNESDQIEKGNVRFAGGYKIGASRGIRDDQDEAIEEFARRLSDEFPHKISIRFNTNRLGGGAWLVDGKRNAQVGLGCDVVPTKRYRERLETFREWGPEYGLSLMDWDHPKAHPRNRVLKFKVHLVPPAVDEGLCNKESSLSGGVYFDERFDTLEEAWAFFTENVNRDGVHPPVE